MEIFNGDNFIFNYSCTLNDSLYEFKKDDQLKVIIYNIAKDNYINEDINFSENTTDININIDSSKMKKLKAGRHILEIKLLNKDVITTLHEKIEIKESWCL